MATLVALFRPYAQAQAWKALGWLQRVNDIASTSENGGIVLVAFGWTYGNPKFDGWYWGIDQWGYPEFLLPDEQKSSGGSTGEQSPVFLLHQCCGWKPKVTLGISGESGEFGESKVTRSGKDPLPRSSAGT
jgi:hypothetical protein